MKNMTKWYIPKKSEIISAEDFKRLITELLDKTNPFERLTIVAISLMYFGLLRQGEVLVIEIIMVKMDWKREIIRVEFSKWTKSRAQGFAFAIPPYLFPVFERYMRELRPKKRRERFLKNYRPSKDQKGEFAFKIWGKICSLACYHVYANFWICRLRTLRATYGVGVARLHLRTLE